MVADTKSKISLLEVPRERKGQFLTSTEVASFRVMSAVRSVSLAGRFIVVCTEDQEVSVILCDMWSCMCKV
jgi:hypothetical protein